MRHGYFDLIKQDIELVNNLFLQLELMGYRISWPKDNSTKIIVIPIDIDTHPAPRKTTQKSAGGLVTIPYCLDTNMADDFRGARSRTKPNISLLSFQRSWMRPKRDNYLH